MALLALGCSVQAPVEPPDAAVDAAPPPCDTPFCCDSDDDCPDDLVFGHCNAAFGLCCSTHTCYRCEVDADCGPAQPFCRSNTCHSCRTDADCAPDAPNCWTDITGSWLSCQPDPG